MSLNFEIAEALDNRRLHLILLPTEMCDCNCTYCYESHIVPVEMYNNSLFESRKLFLQKLKQKQFDMQESTVNSIKLLLEKRFSNINFFSLSWFGGEPLLKNEVIENISEFVKTKQRKLGFQYSSDVTTNGLRLSLDMVNKLYELGVTKYQVTLDGNRDYHDTVRYLKSGGITFEKIWKNLVSIKESNLDVQVVLRLHLHPNNLESLSSLIDEINKTFSCDKRFCIFFKRIEHLGSVNDHYFKILSEKEQIDIKNNLAMKAKNKIFELQESICYAAKPNSLVIRSNGNICKCTVALNDSANHIGNLNKDGTITFFKDGNNYKYQQWIDALKSKDKKTLSCPYSKICKHQCTTELSKNFGG